MWNIVDIREDREICEMIQRKARETQLWCTYTSVFTLCLALEECELSRGSYPSYHFYRVSDLDPNPLTLLPIPPTLIHSNLTPATKKSEIMIAAIKPCPATLIVCSGDRDESGRIRDCIPA